MVVLLAIAGAVAAVLLTRAGTETDRLEGETDRWSGITNETGCEIAGGAWSNPGSPSGSCGQPGTVIHIASTGHAATATDCHPGQRGGDNHSHTFDPGVDANNNNDYTDLGDRAPQCP